MAKADTLSWQEDHTLGMEDNNKGITIIFPDKIGALIVHITDEGDHFIKHIKKATKTSFTTQKNKCCSLCTCKSIVGSANSVQ